MKTAPPKPTKRSPGNAIRVLRERAGFTQAELARRSGVVQSNICRIEVDSQAGFGVNTLFALADALGVEPEEILSLARTPKQEDPFIAKIVAKSRACNPEERRSLLTYFAALEFTRRSVDLDPDRADDKQKKR